MLANQLDISVVICSYTEQRWDYLVAAIDSVRQQTVKPNEIIIVIDHNRTLYEHAQRKLEGVVVIESWQSSGLSGARNCGIAAATGQIIAFLDDDAIATPSWLAELREGYGNPQVMGVGGLIKPLWPDAHPGWFPEEFNWVVGCTYRGMPQQRAAVRNLIGANMSVRRDICLTIGGFRTEVGQINGNLMRCDDTEFCIRAKQQLPEQMFLFEPKAVVFHQVPASRAEWRYFRARCFAEGQAKAITTRLVGIGDALSTERRYVLRTLPKGVLHNIMTGITNSDSYGLARAGVIVAGLTITTAGYLSNMAVNTLKLNRLRFREKQNVVTVQSK